MSKKFVITVSRQYGCGGREFAGILAEKLKVKLFDRQLVHIAAADDYREQRGQTIYDGKTLHELNAENKKRARYYGYYTDQTWGDGANYDLIVNTSRAPLDRIADGIIAYMNEIKS